MWQIHANRNQFKVSLWWTLFRQHMPPYALWASLKNNKELVNEALSPRSRLHMITGDDMWLFAWRDPSSMEGSYVCKTSSRRIHRCAIKISSHVLRLGSGGRKWLVCTNEREDVNETEGWKCKVWQVTLMDEVKRHLLSSIFYLLSPISYLSSIFCLLSPICLLSSIFCLLSPICLLSSVSYLLSVFYLLSSVSYLLSVFYLLSSVSYLLSVFYLLFIFNVRFVAANEENSDSLSDLQFSPVGSPQLSWDVTSRPSSTLNLKWQGQICVVRKPSISSVAFRPDRGSRLFSGSSMERLHNRWFRGVAPNSSGLKPNSSKHSCCAPPVTCSYTSLPQPAHSLLWTIQMNFLLSVDTLVCGTAPCCPGNRWQSHYVASRL